MERAELISPGVGGAGGGDVVDDAVFVCGLVLLLRIVVNQFCSRSFFALLSLLSLLSLMIASDAVRMTQSCTSWYWNVMGRGGEFL